MVLGTVFFKKKLKLENRCNFVRAGGIVLIFGYVRGGVCPDSWYDF